MRILITGGGGYLGSKLAEKLSSSQTRVYLLDVHFNSLATKLESSKVTLVKTDLTDVEALDRVCMDVNPDYIFHFAAILDRNRDFSLYNKLYNVNVTGTLNLLNSLKGIDYKGFYFASTSEVYGTENTVPFYEEQIPAPASPYSLTKLMSENLLQTFSDIYEKPYAVLRIFNYYGPGMPDDTFLGQMFAAYNSGKPFHMTGGEQERDLLYIDELLNQVLYVVVLPDKKFATYNVCSGNTFKLINIVMEFKNLVEQFKFETNLPYRKNEVWITKGSNKRLKDLGYSPKKISLKETLSQCAHENLKTLS